jgi:hypothetical protein
MLLANLGKIGNIDQLKSRLELYTAQQKFLLAYYVTGQDILFEKVKQL